MLEIFRDINELADLCAAIGTTVQMHNLNNPSIIETTLTGVDLKIGNLRKSVYGYGKSIEDAEKDLMHKLQYGYVDDPTDLPISFVYDYHGSKCREYYFNNEDKVLITHR